MRPLVILRPEPGASRTADRARSLGLDVRLMPLFTIVPIAWTAPDPSSFDGLVLTSANAVRHGGDELEKLLPLPVHAVGEATAELARAAGFAIASVGDGGIRGMALPRGGSLLHLAGRDHVATSAAATITVYEARTIPSPLGISGLRDAVVAVHSPRAGGRLAELVTERSTLVIAAISATAAAACGQGWQSVDAAPGPDEDSLLALAARLCEGPGA